ncbi:MAG: TonB-dependent receptor [Niastella sp.]|nr:TonB-dependent receptor [Niastella sp.]
MKKLYALLLVLLAGTGMLRAHNGPGGNGGIKGKITASDNTPADGATIRLKGVGREAVSEEDGTFLFSNIKPGDYELSVTFIGAAPYKQQVTIKPDAITEVSIQLTSSENELREITITAGYNRFNKKETDDVARLPLKNIENPQVYTIVTKEIMAEQVVTDYNSVFKNVPGAGVPVVYNQGRSAMLSRGFTTANLIRNSISGFVYTNIDPANLEVLQAIKGPSGTLFNSSQISFGGLFNRVTKKPHEVKKVELSYSGGSYSLNRLTFDVNSPLNKEKTMLMRINGALHTEQSFQDAGFTRSVMIAPSFMYKATEKLTFLLDIEASAFNATSPIRFAPARTGKVRDIEALGMNYKKSFTNNSLDYATNQLNFFGQVNYVLSPGWKLQTNFTRTYSATKGYVTQLIGRSDSTLQQSVQKEDFPYNGTEIQQNIIGDFTIAGLRNRLVAGVDFYNQRSDRNTPTVAFPAINFKKPGFAYANFNADKVDSAAARAPYSSWAIYRTNQFTYSAYASDVLNITPQLNVMMSLRIDRYEDRGTYYPVVDSVGGAYAQTALSPKFGIVYEVLPRQLSLFGNYMNGFSNEGGQNFEGTAFEPQHANQWEAGLKADLFGHRLTSTISYYNIDVTNMKREDPVHSGFSIQDGTQVSKGIEAEVIANPFGGLNIVAGYTYNDSKMARSNKNVEGLRPATAGPEHLANLWLSYRFTQGAIRGLGFGVGGNYGSAAFQTNDTAFTFTIPSYTVLDATLYYDRKSYRIGVKVDNLTNEKYWSFRLAPQMPTRVVANITFRF